MSNKIETTVTTTTTKTLSFTALKKMIAAKECVDVQIPLHTKTGCKLISVPKKTITESLFDGFETTEAMFAEVQLIRNDVDPSNGAPEGAFVIVIDAAN